MVIDIKLDKIEIARRYGLAVEMPRTGNSRHGGIQRANLVIITVPPEQPKLVHLVRHHACDAIIFARASCWHLHGRRLDEEDRVGHELAAKSGRHWTKKTSIDGNCTHAFQQRSVLMGCTGRVTWRNSSATAKNPTEK